MFVDVSHGWGALLQPPGDGILASWNILVNTGHGEAAVDAQSDS